MAKTVALPAGFKAINTRGDSWPGQNAKAGVSIQGIMHAVKTVHFDEEKKGKKVVREARDVPVYTIRTKEGDVQIWESAGLKALAEVKKGKPVYVRYDGMGKAKPGKNPPRLYTVATK